MITTLLNFFIDRDDAFWGLVYGCSVSPHLLVLHVHFFNIRGGWPVQYTIDITYENLCHEIGEAYSTLNAFLSWIICLKIRLKRTNHPIDNGESSKLENIPKLTRLSILTNFIQTPYSNCELTVVFYDTL